MYIIKKLDARNFLFNDKPTAKVYSAREEEPNNITIAVRGGNTPSLLIRVPKEKIETQEANGTTIADGTTDSIVDVVTSINSIVSLL